jgi:L-serine/L-threonine ammonia-lyase
MTVTVFMPTNAAISTQNRLKELGATVILFGDCLDDAQAQALEYVETHDAFFIPPFNNPIIWQGHSTIIDEIHEQIEEQPDAVVMSVGGGGLMCGIIQGLDKYNWNSTKIITAETLGTSSLKQSVEANQLIKLDYTSGIATTLGAKQVLQRAFDYTKTHDTTCISVTDEQSLKACVIFAKEQKVLVEPACGATLSIAYDYEHVLTEFNNIVLIVCGGINTHLLDVKSAII